MSAIIHANPTLVGATEHAERLADLYGGAEQALWELLGSDWEQDGPKAQQRWRSRIIEELKGMAPSHASLRKVSR